MSHSPLEYLRHILDEMAYLSNQAQGLSKDDFLRDETLKRAFVRSLEIIGEAAKNLPADFRQKYSHGAMSKRRDQDYLSDIREAIQRIVAYTAGMTFDQFLKDSRTEDAVFRNLEVIGEATKNLSRHLEEDVSPNSLERPGRRKR